MKNVFYSLMVVGAALFAAGQATAQDNIASIGLELALPMGDYADATNFGIGATAGYELGFTSNFSALINVGYIYFANDADKVTTSQIPLQLGARYYFTDQREGLYAQALAGVHVSLTSYDVEGVDNDSDVNFSAAPELGYFITENLSIGLRYQMIFVPDQDFTMDTVLGPITTTVDGYTASYLGLRAALNF